jgi:superfamily II DNA or RNA helicase
MDSKIRKFRDIKFPETYKYSSDSDNIPLEFYLEVFPIAQKVDLLLGYFSTNAFKILGSSFAQFIHNGGSMRIVSNHILSHMDKETLLDNSSDLDDEDLVIDIFSDVDKLTKTINEFGQHFFDCLKYLKKHGRLEIVPVKFNGFDLAHCKRMILFDGEDFISTDGSINFTLSALTKNSESFEVNAPWMGPIFAERTKKEISNFEKIINRLHLDYEYVSSQQIEVVINKIGRSKEEKELIEDSINLDFSRMGEKVSKLLKTSRSNFDFLYSVENDLPHFPYPQGPREYQEKAYSNWKMNNNQGIFAMATGTGKTITALNCVLNEYKKNNYYKVIIVVPTKALVKQWEEEVTEFNFKHVVSTISNKEWKETLNRYITRSFLDQNKNLILITTYATFNREHIQKFIKNTKGIESFIYLADEAHNIGSPNTLKNIPFQIINRIGLSATPERIYDDVGSKLLNDFFKCSTPNYTFRYTMKEAIENGILCHYDYFPLFVDLTHDEMEEYKKITKKLTKFIDQETGKYRNEAEMLLLERKRIVHKADNKKNKLVQLIDGLKQQNKLNYTFVFVPEGYEPNYSEIDDYTLDEDDNHIINQYSDIFKNSGYSYYKFIGGINESEEVLKSFSNGDIQVLLSMKCLDEGVDIPRAEHAIFCSSTGNPRQFIQRRGRVLRKSPDKEKAKIWDMIVIPPESDEESKQVERNLFLGEVKRVVNFAALADNQVEILYGPLKQQCEQLGVNLFELLDEELKNYN